MTKNALFPILLMLCISSLSPLARAQRGRFALMDTRSEPSDTQCYTLPNFMELFIDSCRGVLNTTGNVEDRCNMAWEKFSGAFAFVDPLQVNLSSYDEYFEFLKVESEPNSVLFWSGVVKLTEMVSKTNKYPVSSSFNQPASEIINNMAKYPNCWCGGSGGIDYTNPCPDNPATSFWAKFSCILGESASGISFWMGNGERDGGAYRNTSFFTQYEFVKLNPPDDTKLIVIDVHRMDVGEACDTGSLVELKELVTTKFGSDGYVCHDVIGNPNDPDEELTNNVVEIIGAEQNSTEKNG